MDLREKIEALRASEGMDNQLVKSDCDRLLAALDLADAVRWCEENKISATWWVSVNKWVVHPIATDRLSSSGPTLPEAVNALRAKLDKEKEPTRE